MANAKADYSHALAELNGRPIIVIQDLDRGNKSVTNDINNVVEEIAQKERINPVDHYIIYRDSDREWNGYNFSTGQFLPLKSVEVEMGIDNILESLKISS